MNQKVNETKTGSAVSENKSEYKVISWCGLRIGGYPAEDKEGVSA